MRRDQLNRRIHQTSAAAKTERLSSPQVIQRGRAVRAGGGGPSLFKVDSNGTGRGVYRCLLQVFDSSDWDADSTINKLSNAEGLYDYYYVFNMGENYSAVANVLVEGDFLMASQHTDDEGTVRWIGWSPKYSWWHGGF